MENIKTSNYKKIAITYEQRQSFEAYYNFVDFAKSTGLKAPIVGKAYDDFRDFTLQYIKNNGYDAITEAFEVWGKSTNFIG